MTFQELFKNNTIIPSSVFNVFDFLDDYKITPILYDTFYINKYGTLEILEDVKTIDDANYLITTLLYVNENSLKRLYELTKTEYNPIHNYDKNSEITTNFDKVIRNDTNSPTKTIYTNDNTTSIVMNDTKAFNETEYTATDKSTTTLQGSNGKIINTVDTQENTNSSTTNERKDVVIEHTFGNVGVTTSAQMIESEKLLWTNFVFYDYLFSIIVENITTGVYV